MTNFKIISFSRQGILSQQKLILDNRTEKEDYNCFDNHWVSVREAHMCAQI